MKPIERLLTAGLLLGLTLTGLGAEPVASVPARRVFGGTQPSTWLVYAVAPKSLCALNFRLTPAQKSFVIPALEQLPVIGGWNSRGINLETLLALRPDCVVLSEKGRGGERRDAVLRKSGINTVFLKLDRLEDYPAALIRIGEITGNPARGKILAEAFANMLDRLKTAVATIPPERRLGVYYACGADGLETAAGEVDHTQVIGYAGGRNVIPSGRLDGRRFKVSLEQIMAVSPDAIIVRDPAFYRIVFTDSRWKTLPAVKARRVYLIPGAPVSWMDRPPTFMQLLGARWLAGKLYPDRFPEGFRIVAENFYRVFWQTELDRDKWQAIDAAEGGDCRR